MGFKAAPVAEPELLTIPAAAGRLSVSPDHVYDLIADGALRSVDIARPGAKRSKTRVRATDLADYVAGL